MKITEFIKHNILFLDGGMGTLLQSRGLRPGELPELMNLTSPEVIADIHKAYYDAGSHVVATNTFGANRLKLSRERLEDVISAAISIARRASLESHGEQEKWVALDIGPTGRMLKPYGDLDFEEAVSIFAEVAALGEKHGADLILIETMNDSYETKAALLAAKENTSLPVFVSNAYGEDGKLMTGADPAAMVAMLEGLGADAIGVNCSLGPKALSAVSKEYLRHASVPIIMKPNAGLPRLVDGRTEFDVLPLCFAEELCTAVRDGVRIVGGCCGTTPEHIAKAVAECKGISAVPISKKSNTVVSSYTHSVSFGREPILIGERINPTGKKRFKEALRSHDIDYLLREGIAQQDKGVHLLDVNVGLPEIDERAMLTEAVCRLQEVTDLPLQIDTADISAMESALRRYNGKAMINSVNGKAESLSSVLPLAKKYGGVVVALTLDENGIPSTAEGRLAVAKKILDAAREYGIDKKDVVFDPLAMAVSADDRAAAETLRAVRMIRDELGCHVSLGVSNVSFGLPARDLINGTFFAMALTSGLSAAIMNPYSSEMVKTYRSYLALAGLDKNCLGYVNFAASLPTAQPTNAPASAPFSGSSSGDVPSVSELRDAIVKGLKERAAACTSEAIAHSDPLSVVNGEIIPALDEVGVGFEKKTVYLPQLLMSAEAAKAAFEVIKAAMPSDPKGGKCPVVIATVKGDIHDIGKNIVKLILENYGFAVTDLGKDVPPEAVVSEVLRTGAPLVGLSALMTTTVPAMEETVRLLKAAAPSCRVMVGGAVLTKEYADRMGADRYAHDAMEAVRYAEEIFLSIK